MPDENLDPKEAPLLIVEVPALQRPEAPTKEIRDALSVLPHNIGFAYLMKKFAFQRAIVDAQLRGQRQKSFEDFTALQAQSAALGWVESQVRFETSQKEREKTPATPVEVELFQQVLAAQEVLQ